MNLKRLAIVFGHKKQGKSQLLFFLMKLLQRLGEPVVHVFGQLHHPPAVRCVDHGINRSMQCLEDLRPERLHVGQIQQPFEFEASP